MTDTLAQLSGAIDEDAFDPRAYAVLGDCLQELGDPRGELIALQLGEVHGGNPPDEAHYDDVVE